MSNCNDVIATDFTVLNCHYYYKYNYNVRNDALFFTGIEK